MASPRSEKFASQIHMFERDYFLRIHERNWPSPDLDLLNPEKVMPQVPPVGGGWRGGAWSRAAAAKDVGGFLWRRLSSGEEGSQKQMFESMLRFPTAPIFGFQRKQDYQFRLQPIHQHTVRLLASFHPEKPQPVERLFLIFNGVNELDHLSLYHKVSELLITGDNIPTACLICPTPGHLTRYPMHGRYAERPLQRFISDPGDLFRQYMRFMIEIQWLLSVLVPVSSFPVTPGLPLLAESNDPEGGRCDSKALASEIVRSWQGMYEASQQTRRGSESSEFEFPCTLVDVLQSIGSIRQAIGWKNIGKKLENLEAGSHLPPPSLHVIGYSLGGYLAQSAFFAWPFALGTCTALCAGGALQDLKPVKIVHEEEWRSITHGLTFELDCAMLDGRIKLDDEGNKVRGIDASDFGSFYRIFHDVFLQHPHGSYRARVSEFAPRLFFVVGGNDPIVSTDSLVQASPKGGVNLIEIANLTHFIATDSGEWSDFWLPMVAQIIAKLAGRIEVLMSKLILANLWNIDTTGPAVPPWPDLEKIRARRRSGTETLSMKLLQNELDEMIDLARHSGFLAIQRNTLPATLMGKRMLHHRGVMPHFEDLNIRSAWQRIQEQNRTLRDNGARATIFLPGRLNEWFRKRPSVISSKSRALAKDLPHIDSLEEIWRDFLNDWETIPGALWRFNPDRSCRSHVLEDVVRRETSTPRSPMHPILNCLPDVWIGFSKEVFGPAMAMETEPRSGIHDEMLRLASLFFRGERSLLDKWLASGDLRIVRISAANATPEFMGERIRDSEGATDILVHSALAILYSEPCQQPGDFSRGWPP